jgi:hypothetical protein
MRVGRSILLPSSLLPVVGPYYYVMGGWLMRSWVVPAVVVLRPPVRNCDALLMIPHHPIIVAAPTTAAAEGTASLLMSTSSPATTAANVGITPTATTTFGSIAFADALGQQRHGMGGGSSLHGTGMEVVGPSFGCSLEPSSLSLPLSSSSPYTADVLPAAAWVDVLVHSPVFWSSAVMVTIVGLLAGWDALVEYAKEATPKSVEPVIEKILGEMGSLGFIGIVISFLLNKFALGEQVARLSTEYLSDEHVLLETFEFLHEGERGVLLLFFDSFLFFSPSVHRIDVRGWGRHHRHPSLPLDESS